MLEPAYWNTGEPRGYTDCLQMWNTKWDDGGEFQGDFACERAPNN